MTKYSHLQSPPTPCSDDRAANCKAPGTKQNAVAYMEFQELALEWLSCCFHQDVGRWEGERDPQSSHGQLSRGSKLFRRASAGQHSAPAPSCPCNAGMKHSEHRCQSIKRIKAVLLSGARTKMFSQFKTPPPWGNKVK